MCDFIYKGGELFGLRLTRQDGNASAVAHAESGTDVLGEDKLDSLPLNEREKTVSALASIAAHLPQGGKLRAIGLRNIKDVGIAEAHQNASILSGDVLLGFGIGLALDTDDGSKDADAVVHKVNQKRITNSKDLRKLRSILPDPVARAHFLSDSGDLESAQLRIPILAKKGNDGLLTDLETAVQTMKNVPWTALQELKGDLSVLKQLDDAEKLLQSLRKALMSP